MKFTPQFNKYTFQLCKKLLQTSIPLMLGMTGGMIMMLVDRLSLANYSQLTLAASAPAIFTLMTFIMFFTGVASISRTFVAQSYGSGGNYKEMGLLGIIFSIILGCLFLFCYPIINHLPSLSNFPDAVIKLEREYFKYAIFYGFFMIITMGFTCYFNGMLKTRVVMKVSLIGQLINAIATPILVFGLGPFPELGMKGSAIGTIIATFCTLSLFIFYAFKLNLLKKTKNLLKIFHLKQFFSKGIPSGMTACIDELSSAAFIWVVGELGVFALSSLSAIILINYVMIIPIIGLATAVSAQIANAIGENKYRNINIYLNSGVLLGILYVFIASILVLFLAKPFLFLVSFHPGTPSYIITKDTLFIIWTYPLAFVFTMIGTLALQSFGETAFTFWVRTLVMAFITIPGLWLIVHIIENSSHVLKYCWLYGAFTEGLIGLIYMLKIRRNSLKKINLIQLTNTPKA